jgi:hypothetical protein
MADRHAAAIVAFEPGFEPFDGCDIEVVGRLIEQQQSRVQRRAPAPARRGGAHRLTRWRHRGRGRRRAALRRIRAGDRAGHWCRREHSRPAWQSPPASGSCSRRMIDRAGETARRPSSRSISPAISLSSVVLPTPLRPIKRQPVAGIDGQIKATEQPGPALPQAGVLKSQNRFWHGSPVKSRAANWPVRSETAMGRGVAATVLAALSRHPAAPD